MGEEQKGGRDRGRADKVKGKAKEVAGEVTGDDRLRREGKVDQISGVAKDKINKAVDKAEEALSDKGA